MSDTTLDPMSPHPTAYVGLLAELEAYAVPGLGMVAADATPRELLTVAPARLVLALTGLVNLPTVADLGALGIVRADLDDGRRRPAIDVPVRELVGCDTATPVTVGAPTVAARDALDAAVRDVADCACGVHVDRDHAGRVLIGSARPAHTCGRTFGSNDA